MANDLNKQVNMFAKESLRILENELVMAKKVHNGYTSEFSQNPNGFKKGATISINRPTDFTVRDGATMSAQDVEEGSTTITIDKQKGVDVEFTSKELTLDIDKSGVRERVLKPAMIQLANAVDQSLMELYKDVPNWVGTPGQTVNSYLDFSKAPERMDEYAIPSERCAVLAPGDHWGLLGSQTGLFIEKEARRAYNKGSMGEIGGIDTYMSQNAPTHTVGIGTGTPLVNGGSQDSTYSAVMDGMTQSLVTDGWTNSQTGIVKAGDVFTIANVYAVNPVTKATLPFLKQFTVTADANSGASTGPATLTIYPAIVASGAQQNVSAAPADNAAITLMGTGSTDYRQNLVFHKNAFALCSVPLHMPEAAYNGARQTYKGINLRLIPTYNSTTDVAGWRYDILYGVKAIDPRLAVRLSGTA